MGNPVPLVVAAALVVPGAVILTASAARAAKGERAWIAAAQAEKAEPVITVAGEDAEETRQAPVEQAGMAAGEAIHTTASVVSMVMMVLEATVTVWKTAGMTVAMSGGPITR